MSIILRLQIPNYWILYPVVSHFSSLGYLNHQQPISIMKTQGKKTLLFEFVVVRIVMILAKDEARIS